MKNNYRRSYVYALTFALFLTYNSPIFSQNLPQKTISGIITDGADPLSGVNVLVKNSARGSISDLEGRYSLTATANDTLVFTYVGYKTRELAVGSAPILNVVMEVDAQALDAVVINAGYYKVTDREKTGSISQITAEEIGNQVIMNPIASLQGRMTGVHVVELGVPGGGVNLLIRGKGSIAAGTAPLYVIDGIPFNSQSQSSPNVTGRILPGANFSPFSFLNPADIESIEVLKDADATAIYGSRGANGVVLITTKKQRLGTTKYSFTAESGIGRLAKKQKLLNTQQYLSMREQAFSNDGITEYPTYAYDINGTWDRNKYTDWQEELHGGSAYFQEYQMVVSGGKGTTSFLLSGSYRNETPITLEEDKYKRANGLVKINHSSTDGRFNLSLSTAYTHENNDLPDVDLSYQALILPPNAPNLYNEDGSLNWEDGTFNNPLADLEGELRTKRNSFLANAVLELKLLNNLSLRTNLGLQDTDLDEFRTYPHTRFPPQYGFTSTASAIYTNNGSRGSWIIEPQLHYSHQWAKNKLELLMGYSAQNERSTSFSQYAEGFASNAQIMNLAAANHISVVTDTEQVYKYRAFFGRINYSHQEKYIVNITGRRDGSSRFGPNNRFANFGAVGVAWIFSEEKAMKSLNPFFSYGKLRGSYGTTGNDQIGDYRYLNSYTSTGISYNGTTGLAPSALYNPNFGWEENRKTEVAMELGFLNNSVTTTVSYYRNRSSNQLMEIPLPGTTGFTSVLGNLDALIENSGWEFALNTLNIDSGKWKWLTSFNLTLPKNELLEFPGLENSTYANNYVIGKPITINKVLHFTGVDPQTGVYTYQDFNGDGQITVPEDSQKIVDTAPKFYGGLSNTISYNDLSLDIFLQFNRQTTANANIFGTSPGIMVNQSVEVLDAWTNPGDQTDTQAFSAGFDYERSVAALNYRKSDAAYSDISYLRLKNISLSYNLRDIITESSNAKIFIQGQNLLTLTDYNGQDPEKSQGFIPPLRWVSAGLTLTF